MPTSRTNKKRSVRAAKERNTKVLILQPSQQETPLSLFPLWQPNSTRCPCFFTEPWICSVATGAKAKNKIKLRCACRCPWCNMEILIRNLKYTSVFLNLKRYKICNILNTNITQLGSCTPLNFASYAKLLEIYPRIIFMLVCKVCMELKSWQCLDLGSYNFFLFLN